MGKRSDPALARAVNHLEKGAWQRAHEIVQPEDSPLAAWLHGIVHTLEGISRTRGTGTGGPAAPLPARTRSRARSRPLGGRCGKARRAERCEP